MCRNLIAKLLFNAPPPPIERHPLFDEYFREKLRAVARIGLDTETATFFIVGHHNRIAGGALLLVRPVLMLS